MKNFIEGLLAVPEMRHMMQRAIAGLFAVIAFILTLGFVIGYTVDSRLTQHLSPGLPSGCQQSEYYQAQSGNGHRYVYVFDCP